MKQIKTTLNKIGPVVAGVFLLAVQVDNPAPGFFIDLSSKGGNTFPALGMYIIQGILGLVGIIALLFLVIGGTRYITAGGDSEAAESGKKTITNAIIGLVVVILSYTIIVVVVNALFGRTRSDLPDSTPIPTPGTPVQITPPPPSEQLPPPEDCTDC